MLPLFASTAALTPVLWTVGGLFVAVGLLAIASPRHFAKLARFGNHWVDTAEVLSKLDRRVDVDAKLLPHSRLLGASVLVAAGIVWVVFSR